MTRILEALRRAGAREFADVRALAEGPPYCLRVSEQGPYYSLRYRRHESDFRSPVVRQARGIVLEKGSNRVVSWAFDKFYEYGEDAPSYRDRPNLRRSVADPLARYERKYDGALIKVVRLPGSGLLVSTNGRIDAADAPILAPGRAFAHSAVDSDLDEPDSGRAAGGAGGGGAAPNLREAFAEVGGLGLPYEEGLCYAFELLHPRIPTVAPAAAAGLVHLATRRLRDDFPELPPDQRFDTGDGMVRPPEVVAFRSFGSCRDAARLLPWDDEGFVVADGAGSRTKVKSEAYMAMQRLLVGDSESADDDALAVALTLHRAAAPLPRGPAQLITAWRARAESFAQACIARAASAGARAVRGDSSARRAHVAFEAALGGRVSHPVRAMVAKSLVELFACGRDGAAVNVASVLGALRQSRLKLDEMKAAMQLV